MTARSSKTTVHSLKNPPLRSDQTPHPLHLQRVYVKVTSDFDAAGSMTPRSITWTDGRNFPIDAVIDFRPASTLEPGKSGDRYTILIRGEKKYLFFQRNHLVGDHRLGRWWVEVPDY